MFLSACTAFAPPAEPEPTPTPTSLPPLALAVDINPNAIVVPIPIDPPSFNAYINATGYEELIGELVYGALAELDANGNYYPELAEQIPTLANGGLSADGRTVTWYLKPDLRWSDGEPFTAADVAFTWQALQESGIYAPGFDLITNIETPDDFTVLIRYQEFYPDYRLQFGGEGQGILPAHHCGAPDQMLNWDCNFDPVSLGPYILAEWLPGQRLVFNPNPNYWIANRPLNEQLILTIEADPERRQRAIARGNAHLDLWPEEPHLTAFEDDPENVLLLQTDPSRFVLKLVPNLSAPGGLNPAQPHPLFADVRVRQAVRHAINVPFLLEEVFNNRAILADTELARHGCAVTRYRYNPAEADRLLTEAGWIDQDGDGVRECHGCLYAEPGTAFAFPSYRYAEFGPALDQAHRQIELMLFEVGIDMRPEAIEGTELWDTWTNRGVEIRGNFHLDLWDDGYFGRDPTAFMYDLYDPRAIPTRNDPLAGLNVMRYRNPALLDLFDALHTPLEPARQQQLICRLAQILSDDLPTIPLLALPDYYAVNQRLQGVSPHIYDTITWNAGDWVLMPSDTP